MQKEVKTYVPSRCVYETTLACNLHCRHCGSRAGKARADELTTAEATDLFDQIVGLGCKNTTFSGGEPTMRPDWLELIEAAKRAGLNVAMITNGLTFDEEAARLSRKAGLITVGLSVDGVGSTHDLIRGKCGHFNTILTAMAACRKAGLSFTIITTLNRLALKELHKLHTLAIEQEAFSWQVQPCFDMGNMEDNPELKLHPHELIGVESTIAKLIRRGEQRIAACNSFGYFGPNETTLRKTQKASHFKGCAAGMRTLGIESNGNIKGCLSMMAGCTDQDHDFSEGNIRDSSLNEIWNRPGAFAYNREWSIDDLEGFCRECEHAEKCRGGCKTNMITAGRNVENPDCVYRAICEKESGLSGQRAGQAAAVVFAAFLGASAQTCSDPDNHDGSSDSDSDTDTDTDTGPDTDVDTDGYDTDVDIDTDTDTDPDAGSDGGNSDAGDDSGVDTDTD